MGTLAVCRAVYLQVDLIHHNPRLGCMIVPSFDVAYIVFNVLRRFFGCSACHRHFQKQFYHRTHWLDKLQPPAGTYTLSTPVPTTTVGEDERALLEEFRSQKHGYLVARSAIRDEKNKLQILKLWLWRLHNAVTVRTAADTTLAYVKGDKNASNYANCDVRWPPRSACMECRGWPVPGAGSISPGMLLKRDANPDILAVEEEINDFDEPALLDYLKKSYWPKGFQNK